MGTQTDTGAPETDGQQHTHHDINALARVNSGSGNPKWTEQKAYKTAQRLARRLRTAASELKLSDWLMVVLTGIIAFSTAWNTVYVGGQLTEMRRSSQDTKDLVAATQNLAGAAKDQAAKTANLVTAAQGQSQSMDKLRQAGEDQAAASKAMRDSIKGQTEKIAGLYGAIQSSAKAGADLASCGGSNNAN